MGLERRFRVGAGLGVRVRALQCVLGDGEPAMELWGKAAVERTPSRTVC